MTKLTALLLTILLFGCTREPSSQIKKHIGTVVESDSVAVSKIPLLSVNRNNLTTSLPSSYLLDCPVAGDQQNEGSCVVFSCTYGARSIEYYYTHANTSFSYNSNIFSTEYVYNQTVISGCNSGTSIELALNLMKSKVVCLWAKILNTDIATIKTMVYQKHPVIFSVVMDNSFINAQQGFIWSAYSGSGSFPHCMIICGFDDVKNAFKVINFISA